MIYNENNSLWLYEFERRNKALEKMFFFIIWIGDKVDV